MPAHSSTARTAPPAITPVPGLSRTQHDDAGCGLTLNRVGDGGADHRDAEEALASLFDTLLDGRGNFLGLAVADADQPLPSPTITRAVKLKRRPPLTTFETRLIETTRSM